MNFTHKLRRRILVALCVASGAAMTISAGGASAAPLPSDTQPAITISAKVGGGWYLPNAWRTN